jgi:hypothetical protein
MPPATVRRFKDYGECTVRRSCATVCPDVQLRSTVAKVLMSGNAAIGEAAIRTAASAFLATHHAAK